jgi:hypothetical protein
VSLPTVLAGPVVRRVDAEGAAIWIALRDAATVRVAGWFGGGRLSSGPGEVDGGDGEQLAGTASTRRFGPHLHVAVVNADWVSSPPPSTVVSYDIIVGDGPGEGLRALGLLVDETPDGPRPARLALGYADDVLPTFMTPAATITGLRLAQASCRQPKKHGPDATAWIDDLLAETRTSIGERPQQLFLTGDQIYADDVAAVHMAMLSKIGAELLGPETMSFADGAVAVDHTTVPPLRRARPVRVTGRFSSGSTSSHLLTRGEYAAMYLAAWSPSVWRELDSVADIVGLATAVKAENAGRLTPLDPDWPDDGLEAALHRQRRRIERFRSTVPKVARALANVATYMVPDDHEVTDDWNLTAAWTARVRNAALGRSIVRHALGAHIVFQAWGNDPDFVASGAGFDDENLLELLAKDAEELDDGNATAVALDTAFGLTPDIAGKNPDPKIQLDFTVGSLAHVVVGLDTRTRRKPSRGRESPPNLLGSSLKQQVPEGPDDEGRLLVVLSAAPLLMPHVIDSFAQPLAAAVLDVVRHHEAPATGSSERDVRGFEKFDIEGWGASELHFEDMVERLASHPRVVVLSGDIHFSVDMVLDYFPPGDDAETSRIVQLTSSAAKNPPGVREQTIIRSHRWARAALRGEPFERLAWKTGSSIELAAGTTVPPGRRARMRRSPALLPARGWPAGASIPDGSPPDWSWRLQVVRDERPDLGLGQPEPPVLEPFDAATPLESHVRIASDHAQLAADQNEPLRSIVFPANFGSVSFEGTGDGIEVVHEVWSPNPALDDTGGPHTRHRVVLAPPVADDRPQLRVTP